MVLNYTIKYLAKYTAYECLTAFTKIVKQNVKRKSNLFTNDYSF